MDNRTHMQATSTIRVAKRDLPATETPSTMISKHPNVPNKIAGKRSRGEGEYKAPHVDSTTINIAGTVTSTAPSHTHLSRGIAPSSGIESGRIFKP